MTRLKRAMAWMRVIVLLVITAGVSGLLLAASPLRRISWRHWLAARRGLIRLWGKGCLAMVGGRLEMTGSPPDEPYLLVTNHTTYVDTFALAAATGPVFVAKAEASKWPAIGAMMRTGQTLFIQRSSLRDLARVQEQVAGAINEGYGVHIFAQGGIAKSGTIEPFKPAFLEVAASRGIPVYYAGIGYEMRRPSPPAREIVAWLNRERLDHHIIRLAAAGGFRCVLRFGETPLDGSDRKELAREATDRVRAMSLPML
jgi:lyso-ornithine lipid O-acyltransferase